MRVRSQLPYELVWDVTVVQLDRPTVIETDTIVRLSGRFPLRGPVRYTLTEGPDGIEVINKNVLYAERHLPRPLHALATSDPIGQNVSQVQTAADSWKFYGLPKGAPGTLGLCRGGAGE
jgi:hypothetical protein